MDIVLITTNAKYNRLSHRKQKKMLPKLPTRTLTNCYPKTTVFDTTSGLVDHSLVITFDKQPPCEVNYQR